MNRQEVVAVLRLAAQVRALEDRVDRLEDTDE